MPKGDLLGEFEQMVLLAVVRLAGGAYGMTIRREIEERTGRPASIGAVYRTLTRLEDKRLVRSVAGDPEPVRGGRAKRFYRITRSGSHALGESRRMLDSLWDGVELEAGG